MSTTTTSQIDFANAVLNHSALDAVLERIQFKLFQEFITADDDKRCVISDVISAQSLFIAELKIIAAGAADNG